MRINHNIASLNTYRQLTMNNTNGSRSLEKLSSGYRINRAGDDAAGLAISEKMRAQIRGLDMASKNSQDAISLIQTAEGALSETQSILQRMRELAVQAANDTNVSVDRDQIQKEINQLTSEINRIGTATEFNTMKLLNGDKAEIVTSTSTQALTSGVKTVSLITTHTVTATGTAGFTNAVSEISITATGEFALASGTADDSIVIIQKTADGYLRIQLDGENTATGTVLSADDTITADANGNYIYNDHGVTFTIAASAYATITAGSSFRISALTATASETVSLANDWANNTGGITITSGITVTTDNDNKNVRSISLAVVDSADITVTLKDSGGNTLFVDQFSADGGATYNAHGISFRISAQGGSGVLTDLSLTSLVSTTTTSTTSYTGGLTFQVGSNEGQELVLNVGDMRATALSISTTASGTSGFISSAGVSDGSSSSLSQYSVDVSSNAGAASNAITIFNAAITTVSQERAKLGSVQNRLEHTISNLDATAENLQASESRIRDVDMAKEMMEFTKNNILMQAAQSMLAQANQRPQGVLQLLR